MITIIMHVKMLKDISILLNRLPSGSVRVRPGSYIPSIWNPALTVDCQDAQNGFNHSFEDTWLYILCTATISRTSLTSVRLDNNLIETNYCM